MLATCGIGEIVAVVSRYFGGVKLGKGGLGRAYSGSVAKALETLKTAERVARIPVRITVPFSIADALFRLLEELDATDRSERFSSDVEVTARIPAQSMERLQSTVAGLTSGSGRVEILEDEPKR